MYTTSGKPDNYLAWAIVSTLLCCLPLGVVSIVYAAKVDGAWMSGDQAAAHHYSRQAKQFAIASAAVGVASMLVWFALVALRACGQFSSVRHHRGWPCDVLGPTRPQVSQPSGCER